MVVVVVIVVVVVVVVMVLVYILPLLARVLTCIATRMTGNKNKNIYNRNSTLKQISIYLIVVGLFFYLLFGESKS